MKTHRISVTVENNSIRVEPNSLTMTMLDDVHWVGGNPRRFMIAFDRESPFDGRSFSHDQAVSARKPRRRGRFKYSVISEENRSLVLDPEIIVEDPPTGNP